MADETETIRREMVAEINADPGSRLDLESKHGKVWDTIGIAQDFEVLGFAAPLVVVRRRSDRVRGSLMFQHNPQVLLRLPARVIEARMDGSAGNNSSVDLSGPWTIVRYKNCNRTIPAESGPWGYLPWRDGD